MNEIENLYYRCLFPLHAMDARRVFHTYIGKVKIFRNGGTQFCVEIVPFHLNVRAKLCAASLSIPLSLAPSLPLDCPKKQRKKKKKICETHKPKILYHFDPLRAQIQERKTNSQRKSVLF